MLLIPYKQYQLQIHCPPGDILKALRSNVELDRTKFTRWKTFKPFVGSINPNGFKIYRPPHKSNADYFTPVITGKIQPNSQGTSVQIRMHLGVSGLSFVLFMMLICVTFIWSALSSSPLNYTNLAAALIITSAFYTFILFMLHKEAQKDLKVLQGIFSEAQLEPVHPKSKKKPAQPKPGP